VYHQSLKGVDDPMTKTIYETMKIPKDKISVVQNTLKDLDTFTVQLRHSSNEACRMASHSWKEFWESLEQYKLVAPYVLNSFPAAVSLIHAEKNRTDILKGKVSPEKAFKMARGKDSLSFLCARLTDFSYLLGADPNSQKTLLPFLYTGVPSIHAAVASENYNSFKTILRHGGRMDSKTIDNEYPIHYAFSRTGEHVGDHKFKNIYDLYRNESLSLIRNYVIEHTADVNVKDRSNSTPLFFALEDPNNTMYAEKLLAKGALVDLQDWQGNSPLHVAAKHNNTKGILALQEKHPDPNIKNKLGQTPLHVASENGNLEIMKLLLSMGADITLKDSANKLPAEYLSSEKRVLWRENRERNLSSKEGTPSLMSKKDFHHELV
jgi:hypothetical protein